MDSDLIHSACLCPSFPICGYYRSVMQLLCHKLATLSRRAVLPMVSSHRASLCHAEKKTSEENDGGYKEPNVGVGTR